MATAQATASTYTRKLDEDAVPRCLHDATMMDGDGGVGEFSTDSLQAGERPDLVQAHEAAITGHVGCEDRREPSLNGRLIRHAVPPTWTGSE
jgi:hypothetical protein